MFVQIFLIRFADIYRLCGHFGRVSQKGHEGVTNVKREDKPLPRIYLPPAGGNTEVGGKNPPESDEPLVIAGAPVVLMFMGLPIGCALTPCCKVSCLGERLGSLS